MIIECLLCFLVNYEGMQSQRLNYILTWERSTRRIEKRKKYEEGCVFEILVIQMGTHAEQEGEIRINVNLPFAFHSSSFTRSHISNLMEIPLCPTRITRRKNKRGIQTKINNQIEKLSL